MTADAGAEVRDPIEASRYAKLGQLAYEMGAVRLVVDTGMHGTAPARSRSTSSRHR